MFTWLRNLIFGTPAYTNTKPGGLAARKVAERKAKEQIAGDRASAGACCAKPHPSSVRLTPPPIVPDPATAILLDPATANLLDPILSPLGPLFRDAVLGRGLDPVFVEEIPVETEPAPVQEAPAPAYEAPAPAYHAPSPSSESYGSSDFGSSDSGGDCGGGCD
jgi:hypothetical protein